MVTGTSQQLPDINQLYKKRAATSKLRSNKLALPTNKMIQFFNMGLLTKFLGFLVFCRSVGLG